jgi:hypothetical protein
MPYHWFHFDKISPLNSEHFKTWLFTQNAWRSVHELGYNNELSSKTKGTTQVPSFLTISSSWFLLEYFFLWISYLFIC